MRGEEREKKDRNKKRVGGMALLGASLSFSLSSAIVCELASKRALCGFWFLCKSLSVCVQEMAISHYNWGSYFSCLSCLIFGN